MHPVIHPHLVSSSTALGAGSVRHPIGTYAFSSTIQPFSSMGGSDGNLLLYDLSHIQMKFTRIICGKSAALVGDNISPSLFLDLNNSHLSWGKVVGPVAEYICQTNSSKALRPAGSSPFISSFGILWVPKFWKEFIVG